MFPNLPLNPKMQKRIAEMGDSEFELKFKEGKGIDQPFLTRVFYNLIKEMPIKMEFVRFEREKDFRKAKLCLHNCVQNRTIRYFIKYLPKEFKPFTLKITVCPECGTPIAYRFIVYPGDLKNYPKMKDINKYKNRIITDEEKQLPRAIETPEYRIGV